MSEKEILEEITFPQLPVSKLRFEDLELTQTMLDKLRNIIGLNKPTAVQGACITPILKGQNCVARSPTGTGKTLAFAIPLIQKWSVDPYGIYGLIITPTRELANQIKDQFELLGGSILRVLLVIGGIDLQLQAIELQKRPHFVIATPGRLADHLRGGGKNNQLLFKNLKFLVYDEADRMLDGQFDEDLNIITSALPSKKQTLLFTAIMSENLQTVSSLLNNTFVYDYLKDTMDARIDPSKVTQNYILCPPDFKDGYLVELLRLIRDEKFPEKIRSMIIFVATCRECQIISILLNELGFKNIPLHSKMDQKSRNNSLVKFRSRIVETLVATDLASRGLDIPDVDMVINFCVPWEADYVHRIGRAGRGGKKGSALILITPRDIVFLKKVEKYIGEELKEYKIDEKKVLEILTEVSATKRAADINVEESENIDIKLKKGRKLDYESNNKKPKNKKIKKNK